MIYLNIEHEKAIIPLKSGQLELALEQTQAALQINVALSVLLAERITIYRHSKRKDHARLSSRHPKFPNEPHLKTSYLIYSSRCFCAKRSEGF